MRRLRDRSVRYRAVLAVAALYGLLLQAFLVSLQPLPTLPDGTGVICAAHDGPVGEDRTACPQRLCCLAVHAAQPLLGPVPDPVTAAAPWRGASAQVWRMAERPPVRGPPNRAAPPRGPPAA